MYYKLTRIQETELLLLPETGMGYQVIEAGRSHTYLKNTYLILNSELVIEINGKEGEYVRRAMSEGIVECKLDSFFGAGRKGDFAVDRAVAACDVLPHGNAQPLQIHTQVAQHLGRRATLRADQGEEEVLGPDVVLVEAQRLFLGSREDGASVFGELVEAGGPFG